jgi:hypothetical protein
MIDTVVLGPESDNEVFKGPLSASIIIRQSH